MRLPLLACALISILAGCGGDLATPADRGTPATPSLPVPPAVPATPTPAPAQAPTAVPRRAPGFADPLTAATTVPLAGRALTTGVATWSSTAGITLTADGATAATTGGAHHPIPVVAGTIRISATVSAAGSGFTGIALGHGDLSGNFWVNSELILFVRSGGYGLQAGRTNLLPHPDAKLLRTDGPDHLELVVDTVARAVSARINGTVVLADAMLPEPVRTSGLSAAGFRFNEPVIAGRPRVANWRAEVASAATAGLVPVDVAMCFVDPDRPASLAWTAAARGPDDRAPYVITDYAGRQVAAGDAVLTADDRVTLVRTFTRGFYEVAFPAAHQAFGVVALEAHQGPADPFFGMDAGLSWLETDAARRDGLIRILARCGIGSARERMGLGAVNPAPGTYVWDKAPRSFDTLRKDYAAHGVQVLEMLHGGGKQHDLTKDVWFPTAFPALAATTADVARQWMAGWAGAEVENEPDLKSIPAEQYVCIVKADSYALKQTGYAGPVVTGVFGSMPPGPYFDACTANGLLRDSDAVSFHSYDRAGSVEQMVVRYRAWLAAAGCEAMPLWHSECGWPWVKGPDRAPRDQDADSACEIAMKAIESRACGVARHFPFVYTHYEEGPKCFGMMGREATPMRSMAAYAMAAYTLAGLDYRGDLAGVGGPVQLARVFGSGDACVAVLYAGKPDPTAVATLPLAALRAAGADGRGLAIVDGAVPLADGMAYVWLDPAAVAAHLTTDTVAARLWSLGRHPLAQERLASPIVLQFDARGLPARTSARRYLLSQETARALPVRVRIQNLSDAPLTVHPSLQLPGGTPVAAAAVTVPAQGMTEVAWTVDASTALDIASTRMVTVSTSIDGGIQPSPLAIPMVVEGTLEQHLARHPHQRSLPFTDLGRWQANCAGHGTSTFAIADGVWRMSDRFASDQGNWDYPKFSLDRRMDPATEDGFLIRARILHPASPAAIMANPNQPDSFWCPDLFPADGAWHVVYVPFAELKPGPNGAGMQNSRLDPASWRILALGMGSRSAENALEVSHFLVVGD